MFRGLYLFGAMHADRCTQRSKERNQHWSFVLIWYRRWWLPTTDFHMGWNVGPPFGLESKWQLVEQCHTTSRIKKKLRMHCQQEKWWLHSVGMINVLLFWISCVGVQWTVTGPRKCWEFWRLTVIKFIRQMSEVLLFSSDDASPYPRVHTIEAITKFG
jgi:hypothetical protein